MSLLDIPAFVPQAGAARRVSPMGDEPMANATPATVRSKSSPTPVPAPPPQAEEIAMPSGVYPRKPRAAKADQPGEEGKAVTQKRKKPGPRKAKKLATPARAAPRALPKPSEAATYAVDDSGRITIAQGDQRIELSLPDTKRLAGFIDRSKALRT